MVTVVLIALVLTTLFVLLKPLLVHILDLALTLAFTIVHGGFVLVIKGVMNTYMITEKMFTDENDIVCNIIATYLPLFRTIAISIIVLISAWQLFKTFFEYAGFSAEVEEPWKIGIKIMIFTTLVIESKEVCRLLVRMFESVINTLEFDVFNFEALENLTKAFTGGSDPSFGGGMLEYAKKVGLGFISDFGPKVIFYLAIIVIDFKLVSTAIDFAEKYLQTGFLIIISPLVFACGVSKSTSQILSSWVKVFTGTLVNIFIKILLMKILLSVGFSQVKNISTDITGYAALIKSITIVIAFTSLVEQSEQLTRELGFTVGSASRKASDTLSRSMGRVL